MICERGKWEGKQMELWQLFIRYGCHCPGRDTTSRLYQTVAGYKLQKCDKQYTSQIWKFHPGLRHYGSFAYVTISREIKMVNYFWLKLLIENVQWQNFDCISVSCIRCRMQKKCDCNWTWNCVATKLFQWTVNSSTTDPDNFAIQNKPKISIC